MKNFLLNPPILFQVYSTPNSSVLLTRMLCKHSLNSSRVQGSALTGTGPWLLLSGLQGNGNIVNDGLTRLRSSSWSQNALRHFMDSFDKSSNKLMSTMTFDYHDKNEVQYLTNLIFMGSLKETTMSLLKSFNRKTPMCTLIVFLAASLNLAIFCWPLM